MKKNIKYIREKKLFLQIIQRVIFAVIAILIVYFTMRDEKKVINKNIELFENNKELMCKDKIVSKSNGYKLIEDKKYYISNKDEIFNLLYCKELKD